MTVATRYKAISVTVPAEMEQALSELCRKEIRKKSEVVQEALRMYFRARARLPERTGLQLPDGEQERRHTELSAFAPEWASPLDSVYDSLDK